MIENLLPPKEVIENNEIFRLSIKGITNKQLLEFVANTFHLKSPYNNIVDMVERRFKIATDLKFPKKDDRFENEDVVLCDNTNVNWLIISYLKLFFSDSIADLQITRNSFYKILHKIIDIENGEYDEKEVDNKYKKSSIEIEKIKADTLQKYETLKLGYRKRINEILQEIMKGENSKELLAELYADTESDLILCYPEVLAKRKMEGKPILGGFRMWKKNKISFQKRTY